MVGWLQGRNITAEGPGRASDSVHGEEEAQLGSTARQKGERPNIAPKVSLHFPPRSVLHQAPGGSQASQDGTSSLTVTPLF